MAAISPETHPHLLHASLVLIRFSLADRPYDPSFHKRAHNLVVTPLWVVISGGATVACYSSPGPIC